MPKVCFITPTYRGDIEQFDLLRRSIRMFAPNYSHVAIVQTEDYALFRDRFSERGLTLVKSSELLPGWLERKRKILQSKPLRKLYKRLSGQNVSGWHTQQLSKIFALANSEFEAVVFLDSDVFLCRSLADDYFEVDGKTKLFRQKAWNAEQASYDLATHVLLRNPLYRVTQLYDYIFHPCVFRKSTALALLDALKAANGGGWMKRFLSERDPSEYNLLGYTAAQIEKLSQYELIEAPPETWHHSIRYDEDLANLDAQIQDCIAQPKDFFLIQSRLKLEKSDMTRAFNRIMAALEQNASKQQ
jgi:hypothetical protein